MGFVWRFREGNKRPEHTLVQCDHSQTNKSRSAPIIRGRHDRLCWDRPLLSSVWHSDGRPFSNERPVLMSPSSLGAQWPVRAKNGQALGHRVQCTPECPQCCDWPLSANHSAGRGLMGMKRDRAANDH